LSLLLLLAALLRQAPSDSAWSLVTLREIPGRALLFAELAARDGGRAAVDHALLLEVAGRFEAAWNAYGIARGWSSDPALTEWLAERMLGTAPLDTVVILDVALRNDGSEAVDDVLVEIPLPLSHPPYQSLGILQWDFAEEDGLLRCRAGRVEAGTEVRLPVLLRIRQEPWTFRPIPDPPPGSPIGLDAIAGLLRDVSRETGATPGGPCLEASTELSERLGDAGVGVEITGGLLRVSADSLTFHAWNLLDVSGLPLDAVLFAVDSLRGIGHSSTDLIPLWDLGSTGGHEVSVSFSGDPEGVSLDMEAALADEAVLRSILGCVPLLPAGDTDPERLFAWTDGGS